MIRYSRGWYQDNIKQKVVPFVTVAHDEWSSKRNDVLGCSIHFVVPSHNIQVSLPVGLQLVTSKKSDDVAQHLNRMLSRYGIVGDDIFRAISDTTNSALKTGREISQMRNLDTKNTCYMHTQELVVTHALGIRTRTNRDGLKDTFPAMRDLIQKVRILCSTISNKKSKNTFKLYKKFIRETFKEDVRAFVLPNDTRVAGVFLMFESLIKQKDYVVRYCNNFLKNEAQKKLEERMLSNEEWERLAEAESILRLTTVLAMHSQVEETGYTSFAYLKVMHVRYALQQQQKFQMYDVRRIDTPSNGEMTQKFMDRNDLNLISSLLLNRLVKEYTTYFPKPDQDQIFQMFYHPFMVRRGFK